MSTISTTSDSNAAAANRSERGIVLFFCLVAMVHLFVFSAAFPFFNVVDEHMHFDLVVKYSQGNIPRAFDALSAQSVPYLAVFHNLGYNYPPNAFPDKQIPPPPWKQPKAMAAAGLIDRGLQWESMRNYEASQPPLYYTAAALWWRLGKLAGLQGGSLLYWLRFLNLFIIAGLVWTAYVAGRMLFPEHRFIRLAAPALIMVLPQSVFYIINNDLFSPLTFGAVFILVLKIAQSDIPGRRLAAAAGLAFAATLLTKSCNLPFLAVAGLLLGWRVLRLIWQGRLRESLSAWAMLTVCAAVPMAAWMAWCKIHFGDFTGSAAKVRMEGWTDKPFWEWFHHSIYTVSGLWTFWSGNLSTFWQGEILWECQPLTLPGVGLIYTGLTSLFLSAALIAMIRQRARWSERQLLALWFALACVAAGFLFLAWLSVRFDFGASPYPSRAHPYFTSGRLMLGALIPLTLLFVFGLDRAFNRFGERAKFIALTTLLLFMLVSETVTDWQMFPNSYNWYHL